ncbi:galactose-binding domain-containing protein [Nonomuraea rubra]
MKRPAAVAVATALLSLLVPLLVSAPPAQAAATAEQEWSELTSLISGIDDAYTAPPAANTVVTNGYTSALLLGNGDLAVASDARDSTQTLYLGKSDFWNASNTQLNLGKITIGSPGQSPALSATAKDTLECTAACAVDNDPETRWVSGTNATVSSPQWVTVDLGATRSITRWVVRHNGYTGRADNFQKLNTRDFALQTSTDGTTWTTVDTVTGNTAELTDRNVPSFSARYVRLTITQAVQNPADSNQKAFIRDFLLFNGNTDLGGTATAYGTATPVATAKDTLECTAACAVDGNAETRWVSSGNAPQWLTVDLGSAQTINRWVVRHNGYAGRADNFQKLNTRDFALQTSTDGTTWTTVDTVTGNTAELTDRNVPAFSARYVRLTITQPVQDPADPNQKAFIRDFLLFNGGTSVTRDMNYHQKQDILNAEVVGSQTIGGQVVTTRTWPADGENVLVTEMTTTGQALPLQVDVTLPGGSSGVDGQAWVTRATGTDGASGWVSKAAVSAKVLGATATASAPAPGTARLAFTLQPGTTVQLVTSLRGTGSYAHPTSLATFRTQAVNRTAQLDAAAVGTLKAAHRAWWKSYWLKSYVDTGDAVLNKFYYGGLYAVAAVNREGFPFGSTYSPWRTMDRGNGYWMNYNAESQFYGVYSANRAELAKPYYATVRAEVPYARNRTHQAGYKGTTFWRSFRPYNSTRPAPEPVPVAATKNWENLPSDQQSNGVFSALPFLWDYEYTGDEQLFREFTYPYLKEQADFWMDYLVMGADGTYDVLHSAVNEGGDDLNSVYDLGLIRRLLTALITYSAKLGLDAGLRPVWQGYLDKLSPYPTATMDGLDVILLAEKINNPIKGNALLNKNDQPINLEGVVHPSDNLAVGGDPQLLQLVRNTLQWVDPFAPGVRGSSINGFPKTFTIAARAGWDAEDLIGKFKAVITRLWRPNLTVAQSGGAQETSGSVETINSMFLQTFENAHRLFPTWPSARDAKFVRLRAKGAFLLSAAQEGGVVAPVELTSEKGNPFTLVNPWGNEPVKVTTANGTAVAHTLKGGKISFPTAAGQSYRIAPQDPPATVAASITSLDAPDADNTGLVLPDVPEGYRVEIGSSDKPEVVAVDGTITPRAEAAEVHLVLKVTRTADGSSADTAPIALTLPPSSAKAVASLATKVEVNGKRAGLPAVPNGFTAAIGETSDRHVIGLNGKIRPEHEDVEVTLVLTVTRDADSDRARTAPIRVTVPGKKA